MSVAGENNWKELTHDLAVDLERVATLLRNTNPIHDPLTGLVSLAYLELRLSEEVARAERLRIPFCVMAFGVLGDVRVSTGLSEPFIRAVAAVLRTNLRVMDVVARSNRWEFLCLLPEAGQAEAEKISIRLTEALVVADSRLEGLRLAAGYASFPQDGAEPDALIAAARLALLRSRTASVARREARGASDDKATINDQAARLRSVAGAAREADASSKGNRRQPAPALIDQESWLRAQTADASTQVPILDQLHLPSQGDNLNSVPYATTTPNQPHASSNGQVSPHHHYGANAPQAKSKDQETVISPSITEHLQEAPIAVGFVGENKFPVSYWCREELVHIEAVLEEHIGETETSLLVQTTFGLVELVRRGRRWFLVEPVGDQENAL